MLTSFRTEPLIGLLFLMSFSVSSVGAAGDLDVINAYKQALSEREQLIAEQADEIHQLNEINKRLSASMNKRGERAGSFKVWTNWKDVIIPSVEFRSVSLRDVVTFVDSEVKAANSNLAFDGAFDLKVCDPLQSQYVENVTEKLAANRVTLSLRRVSALDVLRYAAELSNCRLELKDDGARIRPFVPWTYLYVSCLEHQFIGVYRNFDRCLDVNTDLGLTVDGLLGLIASKTETKIILDPDLQKLAMGTMIDTPNAERSCFQWLKLCMTVLRKASGKEVKPYCPFVCPSRNFFHSVLAIGDLHTPDIRTRFPKNRSPQEADYQPAWNCFYTTAYVDEWISSCFETMSPVPATSSYHAPFGSNGFSNVTRQSKEKLESLFRDIEDAQERRIWATKRDKDLDVANLTGGDVFSFFEDFQFPVRHKDFAFVIPLIEEFDSEPDNNFTNAPIDKVLRHVEGYLGIKVEADPSLKDAQVHIRYGKDVSELEAIKLIREALYDQGIIMKRVADDKVLATRSLPEKKKESE